MKKFITLFLYFTSFFAVAQAPVNDDCSDAITIPVSPTSTCSQFVQSDMTNATLSPINSLFFPSEKDVWFKFKATSKIHKINVYDFAAPQGNSEKLRIEIAFGSSDLCNPIYYNNAGLATDTLGFTFDFEIGGEYLVKISTYTESGATGVPISNFKICMTTPVAPTNMTCDKAKALNIPANGTALVVSGNNQNVPYEFLQIKSCTSSNPEKPLWYQFKATQKAYAIKFTKALIQNQTQSLTYTVRIIEADSCWSQNVIFCKANNGFSTEPNITYQSDKFVAGKNYFIMVSSQFYSPIAFDFNIAAIQNSPINDDCANAIPLTINALNSCSAATNGTTGNFSPSETPCYSLNTFNGDVWYSFVATKTKHIISISNQSPDDDLHFSVLQGNCNTLYEAGTCYEKDKIELKKLIVGEKYFVVVSNNGNFANFTNHTFSLCVQEGTPPPPNDNPNNATVLEINPTLSIVKSKPGDLTTATNSGISTCTFPNNVEIDVFYSFTATNKQHLLQFFNIKRFTNFSINLEMAMMDNNLNEIFCNPSITTDSTMFFSNLEVGKKYILRVFSVDIYSFDVAVSTPPAPPINDLCAAAITLTPSNDWTCKNPVSGTTYWATKDDETSNFQGYGVWYSFTATAIKHNIFLENIVGVNSNNLAINLLVSKNPCDLDSLIYANYLPNNPISILSGLEIGKKYYINVQSSDLNSFVFFDICVTTPTTIFNNEVCKSAIPLTVNPTEQIVDFINITSNYAQYLPKPISLANVPLWYKFTATSTQHIIHFFNIENILGDGIVDLEIDPYEGNCDSLTYSKILSTKTSNTIDNSISIATKVGKTYWIKVINNKLTSRAKFNLAICSGKPPLNDECSGAFEVKVSPNTKPIYSQNFNFHFATDTLENYTNADVWYSFTANQKNHTLQLTTQNPNTARPYVKIYKGTCSNLVLQKEFQLAQDSIEVISDLQVGVKYFVRFFNKDNEEIFYKLAIGTPPVVIPNDEANNAIAITPTTDCNNSVTLNTTWATISNEQKCNKYKDVWYKFTAQKTQYLLALQNNNTMCFSIFYKNANGILQNTADNCVCFYENQLQSSWLQNLTIGKEYWICVMKKETNDVSFCLLSPPSSPTNDEPQNAINITPNPSYSCTNKATGTANWATPSSSNISNYCQSPQKGDVWYKFTATKKSHFIKIAYQSAAKDTALNLNLFEYNTDSLKYLELTCPNNNNNILYNEYVKGKEYFIRVSGNQYYTKAINFNLCITTPIVPEIPSNDECDAPVVLTVQNVGVIDSTIYTTRLSTAQSTSSICGFDKKDLWYKFVATDTILKFAINLSTKYPIPPPYENLAFSLYQSDACPTLDAQICHQANEIIGGFDIGKSYFIRLLGEDINGFQAFYFDFTVQKVNFQLPINDNCSGAKNIPINKTTETNTFLQETTLFAQKSPSVDSICNKKIKHHDLWYKFTATQTTHYLQIFDKNGVFFQSNVSSGLFAEVYQGNCNSTFSAFNCTSSGASFENIELKNLTIGETYYVRTYLDYNFNYNFLNYRIAVSEKINTSGDCNNAISLISKQKYENSMSNPVQKITWADFISLKSASQNWYKFKAKSNLVLFNLTSLKKPINSNSSLSITLVKGPCADADMVVKQNISTDFLNTEQPLSELDKDSTYYLVFFTAAQEDLTYQFYIEQVSPKAVNTTCQGAITVPVNPTLSPISVLKDSLDTRFSNQDNIRYYKFVATSSQHYFHLKTTKQNLSGLGLILASVYPDCTNSQSLTLSSIGGFIGVANLIPSQTYYFSIASFENDKKYYELAILTQNTIASNDLCGNAISLDAATTNSTQSVTSIPIVLKNGTSNEPFFPTLPYQWYHFTAKSKNHILKIKNYNENTSAPTGQRLYLKFDNISDCSNFIGVKNYEFQFLSTDSTEILLQNLVVGKKYNLAMARESSFNSVTNFNISITGLPTPPNNDLCPDAISLTVSPNMAANVLESGTLKNALTEPFPNASCHEFGNHTVWYKFKATATKHAIVFQKPANYDLYFDAFQGKCDSLTFLTCHFDSLTLLPNLKIGNEYFIAVGTQVTDPLKNLNFKIAIVTPTTISTNVDCSKATNLPVSTTNKVQQYVNGDFQFQNELWYKFTATAKSHRIHFISLTSEIKNETANYTPISAIIGMSSHACTGETDSFLYNTLNAFTFNNLLDTTSNNNIISGLVIGKTYYLGLAESAGLTTGKNIPFKIGLYTDQVPNNQTRLYAQNLPINPGKNLINFYSENTKGLRINSSANVQFEVTATLWYEFTATAKRHQLLMENLQSDAGYYVNFSYFVQDLDDPFNPKFSGYLPNYNTDKDIIDNLTIGKKYYISINLRKTKIQPDGTNISNINMTYRIGLTTHQDRPKNDDCQNADQVPVNTTPNCQQVAKGTTLFATNLNFSQKNGNDDNVWYKFTATSERHFIQLKNIKPILGNVIDMEFAVYKDLNNDCTNLQLIGNSNERIYPLAPWKTTIGQTYYIEVYTRYYKDFSRCEFDLCVSTPIANDDYKGAILLSNLTNPGGSGVGFKSAGACTNALTASSLGATYSFDAGVPIGSCNIGTLPKDIWFKTVVGAKRNLAIQVLKSPTGADVQIVAYKIKNDILTALPNRCPSDTLLNLTQGDTIALRVWDAKGVAFGDYTLCVESFEKTTDVKTLACTNVNIHPVPTSDYLNFNVDFIEVANYKVEVLSVATGQIVKTQTYQKTGNMNTLEVRNLPPGNYVLKVFDSKKLFTKQFIKI